MCGFAWPGNGSRSFLRMPPVTDQQQCNWMMMRPKRPEDLHWQVEEDHE